jgi:hypothetical protein
VLLADTDYLKSSATRGGGGLIAVSELFHGVKRRFDLDISNECVWIETHINDNYNLLLGNHYIASDCNVKITENYFNFFGTKFKHATV